MSFQDPGPLTSQYGPDPIIQPVAYDQPGPLMEVAPPLSPQLAIIPIEPRNSTVPIDPAKAPIAPPVASLVSTDPLQASFVPTDPSRSQNPPDPLMSVAPPMPVEASFVPTDPLRPAWIPPTPLMSEAPPLPERAKDAPPIPYVTCDMAPPTAPRSEQQGTGHEPIRSQEVPPGIKASHQPTLPAPAAVMLGPDDEPRSDIKPPDPAPCAELVPPQPSRAQFPPEPAPMASELPPGMIEVGTGHKNIVPPQPMMTEEVPIGYEPIRCSELPTGYEPAKCEQVPTGLEPIRYFRGTARLCSLLHRSAHRLRTDSSRAGTDRL